MPEFIRARSVENKEERLSQIKKATEELFEEFPYHEISLTTIAQKLGWSRANLYKYATTKEEIFLEITADKMTSYYTALTAAFPEGNNFSPETVADIWAGILNANQDYLKYTSFLLVIIETNVTVERLAVFKKKYYDLADALQKRLASTLHITEERAAALQIDILHFGAGTASICLKNPLVKEALKLIGKEYKGTDFYKKIQNFVLMEVLWCGK